MTLINESIKMKCHCGKNNNIQIYNSVNVTVDPQLLKKVYSREINVLRCKKCKREDFIYQFLLHVMEKKLAIWCYPTREDLVKAKKEEGNNIEIIEKLFNTLGTKIYRVVGYDELIRTIDSHL